MWAATLRSASDHPLSDSVTGFETPLPEDLQAFAASAFAPGRLVLTVAGDRRAIEPSLSTLGPFVVQPNPLAPPDQRFATSAASRVISRIRASSARAAARSAARARSLATKAPML